MAPEPWWLQTQPPEVDPDRLSDPSLPKPDTVQLDSLFWAESIQLLRLGGLRAHESQILQEVEPYTPRLPKGLSGYGSEDSSENEEDTSSDDKDDYSIDDEQGGTSLFPIHKMPTAKPRPWMERDFVEVDETKWFKLFRRERWASYLNQDPLQLSVDISNDKDWAKLSRVIEIANRILSEAVNQQWLATFLDPQARDTRGPVSSGNRITSWDNTVVHRAVPVPPHARPGRKQACKALDDFAESIFWGFHMPDEYAGVAGKTGAYWGKDGRWSRFMTLTLTLMEPVFREKTRGDPEGRQCAVGMAHVMLHELSHSLSGYFHEKMPRSHKNMPCMTNELFFKEERWAEAGYSFESAVFGTTPKDSWSISNDRIQYIGMCGMTPETCASSAHCRYDGWAPENPFLDMALGIPAIFPCAMTTSDFWDVHVRKYGYPSLRWTWVCEGRYETSNGERQMRPAKIMGRPYSYSRYDELNRSMKAVAQKLRIRRLHVKWLRPWYAQEYAFWSRTLYAETTLRYTLGLLSHMLCGYSFQNEAKANLCIKELLKPHSRLSDLEGARPEKARTSKMFYHAMGFLAQAALPVRTGTITYRDNGVVEYPDRLRPALRPTFAGDLALLDQVTKWGKRAADAKRIKTLYDDAAPSHDRELCMSNAQLAFRRWQLLGFVSTPVARDFEREWQLLRRQMDQRPLDDARLDWSPGTWKFLRRYFGQADHQVSASVRPGEQMEQKSEGVDTDIPAGAIARPAIPTTLAAPSGPVAAPWIPYYNPGEVGDHQRLNGINKWCCAWTGREMAIYDVSDLLAGGSWTKATRAYVTMPVTTSLCRVARTDNLSQAWTDRFSTERPLGYVATARRIEDVRINDGKEGRPRWVMAGEDAYDVTNVELPPELQDLEVIFTEASHEDPVAEAVNRGYHPDVIQAALRPYRIGWAQKTEPEILHLKHHVFTASEVKWHTTRETGIYIIIRGKVYDFTNFIDLHPGGSSIIAQVAGTDATSVWDRFHGSPTTEFGFNAHQHLGVLEIGRVIEERSSTVLTLSPTEICIRGYIYSKDKINANNDRVDVLNGYWGTDGTADMEKPNPSEAYLQLWETPGLIVAKMVRPTTELPYMSPKVLEKMDGKERPDGFNESWVSSDCIVYNVTSLVRYSSPTPILEKLKSRAGSRLDYTVVDDRDLIDLLTNNCSHRIIGLLHTPKRGRNSEEKAVAWKTSHRLTPATTPKAVPQAGGSAAAAMPTPAPASFTVRPLRPLRKKKKNNNTGTEYSYPKPIDSGLPSTPNNERMGEPMDESSDGPIDDPMDISRIAARTVLERMGFPAELGRGASGHERKTMGW